MLLQLLQGEFIPQKTILRAKLTIRESCGCFRYNQDSEELMRTVPKLVSPKEILVEKDIVEFCMSAVDPRLIENVQRIVPLFCDDVNKKNSVFFLKMIEGIGRELIARDSDLSACRGILRVLWNYTVSNCNGKMFSFADDLLHRAFIICGDIEIAAQGMRRIRTVRKNSFLHEIGDVIRNTLDFKKLLDALCVCLPRVGIRSFYLSLYEPASKDPGTRSRLVLACIDGKRTKLAENGIVFETNDLVPEGIIPRETLQILIAEPLYFQKEQFGIMLFKADMQEPEYYNTLKEYISGALYSASLLTKVQHQTEVLAQANTELEELRETEHAYLQAIKNELELGTKIQMGFLPRSLPTLPGWEISAAFMPAREVSGDFYDAFTLGDDMVALVIADVSGKDVSAALFMSLIRTIIRVFSERAQADGDDPLGAVKLVNDYILRHHSQEDGRYSMFATIFFGLLKPSTGELRYVNAGHNAPKIISGNKVTKELPRTGLAVGLSDDTPFAQKRIVIEKGEILFAYTDGVTEAKNPEGEFFTRNRLVRLLEQKSSTAAGKVHLVKTALIEHNRGEAPFDDITMLVIKRD
jgi:serine phosphatase RsbU (regulator of sigma subunit)